MKIGNCSGGEQVELEKLKHGGKRATFGAEFRDLLDQELAGAQVSAGCCPLQSETAEGIGSVSGLPALSRGSLNHLEPVAIPEVERLEDAMARLSARLEGGKAGLMDIEEALNSLRRESGNLSSLTEGISPGNPLRQLGQDLSVLSYVESVKWQRGDYL
jgi:hypothetical protein